MSHDHYQLVFAGPLGAGMQEGKCEPAMGTLSGVVEVTVGDGALCIASQKSSSVL